MSAYRLLFLVHIVAGTIALTTYWAAAIARKGSPWHKRVGKTYLVAMMAIIATAIPMAVVFFARGKPVFATFLAYLVVITATACWVAWRAIQLKRDKARFAGWRLRAVGALNIVVALCVLALGYAYGQVLLMGFSAVGLVVGTAMVSAIALRKPDPKWWLRQHYSAMLGNGVATHIAFLNVGLARLFAEAGIAGLSYAGWFAPIAVALMARLWLDRKYGAPLAKPRATNAMAGG